MLRSLVSSGLVWFDLGVLTYFLALNTLYLSFTLLAFVHLRRHLHRWTSTDLDAVIRSPATPGISLIVPAYNEEATISESVRSLLLLNYPAFEVVVVVDGAKDRTMAVLRDTFDMLVAPASYTQPIPTQSVQQFYRSIAHPELVAIDKANGGKADAINAGINAARYPLVCVLDADSLLEEHALTRVVLPFIERPDTVAAGGVIRIANGCQVRAGRVVSVGLPQATLARFQVVEYLRAFLAGRTALSALNALLIISGAFGLFRRDAVVEVGGFRTDTVGEDMEIVVRLHRRFRERREPCRIVFRPDAVCWTEAPESRTILRSQRNRWQRGTLQVMEYHRALLGNPRYGMVGLFGMPFYFLFETVGPIVEVVGLAVTLLAVALGLLDSRFAWLMFLAAVAYGAVNSVGAILLEEVSYRRYARLADLLTLCAYACVENLGYRQLTTWWRAKGTIDYLRKQQSWGTMTRKGFAPTAG